MAVNNIVQLIFPEFKKLFSNIYGESALAILKEYPSVKKLAKERGISEKLKATNQLRWVQEMSNCKAHTE